MADPGARPRDARAVPRPALRPKSTVREYAEALAVALLLALAWRFDPAIAADEVGQVVATAAIASAMVVFAMLELRAAR